MDYESENNRHPIVRRNAKDTVFTDLFRDPKYLLQLYRCLHPEDTDITEEQIQSVTLKGVMTNTLYNDLGFLVEDRLVVLVEAQSTWSANIIIRALIYLTQTWQEFLNREGQEQSIYSSKKVTLPKPELYVIYTGDRPVQEELTLSEEFFAGQPSALECRVKVIRDGKQGDIISQYVAFTRVFNEQVARLGRTREAMLEIVRICKDGNILKDYLKSRETEVETIMMLLFDDEWIMKNFIAAERREAREEAMAEGLAEGRAEGQLSGILQNAKSSASKMLKMGGFSMDTIADISGLPIEDVRLLAAQLAQ